MHPDIATTGSSYAAIQLKLAHSFQASVTQIYKNMVM